MEFKEFLLKVNKELLPECKIEQSVIDKTCNNLPRLLNCIDFSKQNHFCCNYAYGLVEIEYSHELSKEDMCKARYIFRKIFRNLLNMKGELSIKRIYVNDYSYEDCNEYIHYDYGYVYIISWFAGK